MNFGFLDKYIDIAVNQYHVDPLIFIVLYLITIPTFYFGVYKIGKATIENKSKDVKKRLLSKTDFNIGFIVVLLSLIVPYVYVLFFGRNIPTYFWLLLSIIVIMSGVLAYKKIKKHKK